MMTTKRISHNNDNKPFSLWFCQQFPPLNSTPTQWSFFSFNSFGHLFSFSCRNICSVIVRIVRQRLTSLDEWCALLYFVFFSIILKTKIFNIYICEMDCPKDNGILTFITIARHFQIQQWSRIYSYLCSWYLWNLHYFSWRCVMLSLFDILIHLSPSLFFVLCSVDVWFKFTTFCSGSWPYSVIMYKCLLILMAIHNGKMNKTLFRSLQHSNKIVFVYFYLIVIRFCAP